jgi:carbon storage regulator
MLVLTRKLQQQIKIGEQITVTILRVKGSTVRIGIQAPREVRVVRGELPKAGAAAVEVQTVEEVAFSVSDDESTEPACATEDESSDSKCMADETPAPLAAAHLPLRRVRNRHGSAPLKQLIASCATLAK